jgi:hypothetical protein
MKPLERLFEHDAPTVDLGGRALKLSSVRRHESHLYLRYAL